MCFFFSSPLGDHSLKDSRITALGSSTVSVPFRFFKSCFSFPLVLLFGGLHTLSLLPLAKTIFTSFRIGYALKLSIMTPQDLTPLAKLTSPQVLHQLILNLLLPGVAKMSACHTATSILPAGAYSRRHTDPADLSQRIPNG